MAKKMSFEAECVVGTLSALKLRVASAIRRVRSGYEKDMKTPNHSSRTKDQIRILSCASRRARSMLSISSSSGIV
jgi:hypothetical protein